MKQFLFTSIQSQIYTSDLKRYPLFKKVDSDTNINHLPNIHQIDVNNNHRLAIAYQPINTHAHKLAPTFDRFSLVELLFSETFAISTSFWLVRSKVGRVADDIANALK